MKTRTTLLIFILLCLASSPAFADFVWPAVILEERMLSWWVIAAGLLIEFLIVRRLFALTVKEAGIATLLANGVSTVAGIPLLPIAGLAWEVVNEWLTNQGTFNPVSAVMTFLLACLINTVIEVLVYKHWYEYTVGRREVWWVFVANALSVGVAFGSLFVKPPEM